MFVHFEKLKSEKIHSTCNIQSRYLYTYYNTDLINDPNFYLTFIFFNYIYENMKMHKHLQHVLITAIFKHFMK